MGGTSTDVSRWDGEAEVIYEGKAAGVQLQVPQLDIKTVAAGGGSILSFRSGLLRKHFKIIFFFLLTSVFFIFC